MTTEVWPWVLFNGFVMFLLALDLGVFHRKNHTVGVREAAVWSIAWISLALLFNVGLYWTMGAEPALQFFAGYLLEKSLSVDNIFVFALLFSAFHVPPAYQHRVLFWGILGALIMRGTLIGVGAYLVSTFTWVFYLFGGLLIVTGARMALSKSKTGHEINIEGNLLLRLARKLMPVTDGYRGGQFLVREQGRLLLTPLMFVLLMVESTDLLFALDSIPAIFAVTRDPFLVYSSNVFAILGLRSLYFLLAGAVVKFRYLKPGLALILSFVGLKMLVADYYHLPIAWSLGVIFVILAGSIAASIVLPVHKPQPHWPR